MKKNEQNLQNKLKMKKMIKNLKKWNNKWKKKKEKMSNFFFPKILKYKKMIKKTFKKTKNQGFTSQLLNHKPNF